MDSAEIANVSLATVEERAQAVRGATATRSAEIQGSGCGRLTDGNVANVEAPGGTAGTAERLF